MYDLVICLAFIGLIVAAAIEACSHIPLNSRDDDA
jgi:hypothetical protein